MTDQPSAEERALDLCQGRWKHIIHGPQGLCDNCMRITKAIRAAEQAAREQRDREWTDAVALWLVGREVQVFSCGGSDELPPADLPGLLDDAVALLADAAREPLERRVEELQVFEDAVGFLATPPESVGDGPHEKVRWTNQVLEKLEREVERLKGQALNEKLAESQADGKRWKTLLVDHICDCWLPETVGSRTDPERHLRQCPFRQAIDGEREGESNG